MYNEVISDFYVTGSLSGVAAWRWQLGLILFSFLFILMIKNEE